MSCRRLVRTLQRDHPGSAGSSGQFFWSGKPAVADFLQTLYYHQSPFKELPPHCPSLGLHITVQARLGRRTDRRSELALESLSPPTICPERPVLCRQLTSWLWSFLLSIPRYLFTRLPGFPSIPHPDGAPFLTRLSSTYSRPRPPSKRNSSAHPVLVQPLDTSNAGGLLPLARVYAVERSPAVGFL